MRKSLWFVSLLVVSTLWLATAGAQERRGSITGRVLDSSRAVVQGARVEVQPGGQTAVTDGQGEFTIAGVPPGKYTVTVSAVGFAAFSNKEVTLSSGGVANVEATLQVEAKTEVIEVRAERQHGEVEALNRELTADNIVQVLPNEVITSLPNTNIADAVGRLPSVSLERDEGEGKYVQVRGTEPRLSNVTVDGVHLPSPERVRNVKLDAIPADLVDSVELSKTLSANQEGDAIGGSVNLVTKSASNQPYISLLGTGGYTSISGGHSAYQVATTLGQRFGSKKQLGLMVGGSYDWNGRGIDDIEPSVGTTSLANGDFADGVPVTNGIDFRQYWYDRTRFGFGGSLDYKLGDWSTAYIRGLFSQFKDDGQDWIYSPSVGSFASATQTNPDGSVTFSHVTRKPAQRLFSTTAGAHHTFGQTLLNYEVSFGQARFTGFFPSARFDGPGNVQFGIDTSNPFTPKFKVLNGINIFDPTQYTLRGFNRGDDHTFERDVTGAMSVARRYKLGSRSSVFEIGAKVRDSHKSELDVQQSFSAGQTFLMSSVLGTFTNSHYYFGVYPYGPVTNYAKIIGLYNANPSAFTDDANADLARTIPGDFNADERVTAGYLMNTIDFARVRLQVGVRIEATSNSFLANQITLISGSTRHFDPNSIKRLTGGQDYVNVLPSIQSQFRFAQDTILRLAYSMGIARPNFGDLPPFVRFDPTPSAPPPQVVVGNPNLKTTTAQNFDILIERYLKPIGVIEGGFFYKYLSDPIYPSVLRPATGVFAGNIQSEPFNGPVAHLYGFEMAWQQRLSFLPGLLNGSGVRANYSYTNSQATFPTGFGRTDTAALLRQAPNNWNFDYTYDKKGISARMGLTHNDANIFAFNFQDGAPAGIKGPNGDVYLYPHTQVDAQVSYWLPRTHGLQVIASFLNLNNEVFGFYQGSEKFPIQREYYNPTYSFGLRWSPSREQK